MKPPNTSACRSPASATGRTPFQLFTDVRFLGNNRIAPCSRTLKQIPCRNWLTEHADPNQTVLYVGIDSFEAARTPGIVRGWDPWRVDFPLCEEPFLSKEDMLDWAVSLGLRPPVLYYPPFSLPHANCSGFCVRAGIGQWSRMIEADPEGFRRKEAEEQQLRELLGDVAILRDRRGGQSRPLPLSELRTRPIRENRRPTA